MCTHTLLLLERYCSKPLKPLLVELLNSEDKTCVVAGWKGERPRGRARECLLLQILKDLKEQLIRDERQYRPILERSNQRDGQYDLAN